MKDRPTLGTRLAAAAFVILVALLVQALVALPLAAVLWLLAAHVAAPLLAVPVPSYAQCVPVAVALTLAFGYARTELAR